MPNRASLALYAAVSAAVCGVLALPGEIRHRQSPKISPATAPGSPAAASSVLQAGRTWSERAWGLQRLEAATSPEAGIALFREKGCIACHGNELEGTDKGPRLTGVGRTLKREQIEHQIRNGGDNMPAFGEDAIAPDELAVLVDFLAHQKRKK